MHSHLLISFSSGSGTLHVADELDQPGEVELQRRIDDALTAGCTRLEVDCSRVRRIGRPSLAALAAAKAHLEARGGSFVVTGRSPAFVRAARADGYPDLVDGPGHPEVSRRARLSLAGVPHDDR
ncbi:MAG TPA: STAS domain-containing protein [Nocardioides sp.]|nr:STAS domain-containing protein [Nocardioides sp.]